MESNRSSAPLHQVVGRVLSRFYDVQLDDPIHIIADYDPAIPDGGELMSKAHEAIGGPGLTITAHGCQHPGSIWLDWPDVPVLIAALQQALRDAPNPRVDRAGEAGSASNELFDSERSNGEKPCG